MSWIYFEDIHGRIYRRNDEHYEMQVYLGNKEWSDVPGMRMACMTGEKPPPVSISVQDAESKMQGYDTKLQNVTERS